MRINTYFLICFFILILNSMICYMKKLSIVIYLIISSLYVSAQAEDILVTEGYLGYSMANVNFQPKGYSNFGAWEGVEANFVGMTFSFHEGQLREIGADSTVPNVNGSVFKIGYRMGPENWTLGKSSTTSINIKPYMQISGSVMRAKNKNFKGNVSSAGLVFSPGIQLRFSHFYLSASYDAGVYLNTAFGNGKYNTGKGFIGGTTFTVGVDNAFDLLKPSLFSFKGYNVNKEQFRKDNGLKYDSRLGYYREIVYTTVTEYTPGERTLSLLRPFWGVGPSYSFKALKNRQASTAMRGANVGIRFWYLMLDGFYEEGTMGLESKVDKEEILINYPILRDYDFSSQVGAKNYGGRIGFNLSKFFALDVNFKKTSGFGQAMKVPFMRLNVFYTQGVTEFLSTPDYVYDGGSAKLNDYQTFNNITADASNNPDYIPQKTTFTGWGGSFEIGSAYFAATWYKYKDAAVADHMNFTVGANIPLGRMFHSARARYFL